MSKVKESKEFFSVTAVVNTEQFKKEIGGKDTKEDLNQSILNPDGSMSEEVQKVFDKEIEKRRPKLAAKMRRLDEATRITQEDLDIQIGGPGCC